MGRVRHFEIHASDPDASMAFYAKLFGWSFERFGNEDYWPASSGGGEGVDGAILRRRGPAPKVGDPVMGATISVYVDDLDATLGVATELGSGPVMETMTVPGYGRLNYVHDPDNNIVGLFQPDAEAK